MVAVPVAVVAVDVTADVALAKTTSSAIHVSTATVDALQELAIAG